MLDPTCRMLGHLVQIDDLDFRIDAFCVITGTLEIGGLVHVGTGSRLLGTGGVIHLAEGSGVSMGCSLLTSSDDFAAPVGIGPLFPAQARRVKTGNVVLEPMAAVGAHSIVMPGCTLEFGARLGANSFLTHSIPAGEIWFGNPAKKVGQLDLLRLRSLYQELFE